MITQSICRTFSLCLLVLLSSCMQTYSTEKEDLLSESVGSGRDLSLPNALDMQNIISRDQFNMNPVDPDPDPDPVDPDPVDPVDPDPVDPDPNPVDPDPNPVDPDPNPVDPIDRRKIDVCVALADCLIDVCVGYDTTDRREIMSICMDAASPQDVDILERQASCQDRVNYISNLNATIQQGCAGESVAINPCVEACEQFALFCAPNCPGFLLNESDFQSACLSICDQNLANQLNTSCNAQIEILKQYSSFQALCNPPPPNPCINACQTAVNCANGFCPGLNPATESQMQQACLSMCNQELVDFLGTLTCDQQARHLNYFNQNFNQICARPKENIPIREACIVMSECANTLCPFYLPENQNYLIASCMLEANQQIAYDLSNLSCTDQIAYIGGINPVFRNNCPMPPDPVPLDPCEKNCSFVSACMPQFCPYFPFSVDEAQADCVYQCNENNQIARDLNPLYSCEEKIAYAQTHLYLYASYCSDAYNSGF